MSHWLYGTDPVLEMLAHLKIDSQVCTLNAETTRVHADCRTYLQGSPHFKTAITFDAKQTLKSEAKIKMSRQSLIKDLLPRYKILVHLRQFYNE